MPKKKKSSKSKTLKKPKPKTQAKTAKPRKSAVKPKAKASARPKPKPSRAVAKGRPAPRAKAPSPKPAPARAAVPSRQFAGAVAALEAGIKLMYAEDYSKAVRAFNKVIADFPDEPEVLASAKARVHACEKKLQERSRTVFRNADDHYNVAVALLNAGDLDSAVTHLQSALKLAPKADHVLYAMAAVNALKGNTDQALSYLKQSIHSRPENRFQAMQDDDFAVLAEEQAFKDLVTPSEK